MEHFAPNIAEFLPPESNLQLVSSSWRENIQGNERRMREGLMRKNLGCDGLGSIAIRAVNNNDYQSIKKILSIRRTKYTLDWNIISRVIGRDTDNRIIDLIDPLLDLSSRYSMNIEIGRDNTGVISIIPLARDSIFLAIKDNRIEHVRKRMEYEKASPHYTDYGMRDIYDTIYMCTPEALLVYIQILKTITVDPILAPLRNSLSLFDKVLNKEKNLPHIDDKVIQLAMRMGDVDYLKYLESIYTMKEFPFDIIKYLNGKMLIYVLSEKRIPLSKYIYGISFKALNAIINMMKVSSKERNEALAIAIRDEWVYLIDCNINKDNVIGVFASYTSVLPKTSKIYPLLSKKGLQPLLFYEILNEGKHPEGDLWKKILATAAAYNNSGLIMKMYERYKPYINPQMIERIIELSGNSSFIKYIFRRY